jgi:hypothetical protein
VEARLAQCVPIAEESPPQEQAVGVTEEAPTTPAREHTRVKERSGEIDVLRNLGELIGDLDALMTEVTEAAEAETDGAAPAVATDSSGTIEVTMGGDGLLSDFRLRRGWHERLPQGSFDSAAQEAISNAVLRATNTHYARQWRAAPALKRPPDTVDFVSHVRFPAGDPDAALRQVNLLIGESMRELEDLERTAAHRSPTEIKSKKTVVTLSVLDGTVTAVHTNRSWLARADAGRVCEEFMSTFDALNEAIASAWKSGPGASGEEGDLPGAFAELQRVIQSMGFPSS